MISSFICFETLDNVNQLISNVTEVTSACVANIISASNSITIKNLLIDNYIMNIDHSKRLLVKQRRAEFKDWLAEKMSQKLQTTIPSGFPIYSYEKRSTTTAPQKINTLDNNISSCHPVTNFSPLLHSTRAIRRSTYSTAVFRFSFPDSSISFDAVARLFNTRFSCNVNSGCKLVKKERCRKTKDNTTQLFKCNCCTTDILLQFRHSNSCIPYLFDFASAFTVEVFIKNNMIDKFNNHFAIQTSSNNDILHY
jgi:hypothetical protein